MRQSLMRLVLLSGVVAGLAACTNPYDPGQRAIAELRPGLVHPTCQAV